MIVLLIAAFGASAVSAALQEKGYLGAQACGTCHPAQLSSQSSSGHARALSPAASHGLANSFVSGGALRRGPKFEFRLSLEGRELKVSVSDAKDTLQMPVEWAFGSGNHAVTFVSQVDEDFYVEHHFTFYTLAGALDVTPGHQRRPPGSLAAALGVLYRTFDPEPSILRCFRCHSTGRLTLGEKLELHPGEVGVRCEACHGPGSLHAEAAGRGELDSARTQIRNPGRLGAAELNQLCGACHRKPAPAGAATNWNDPWNTRHQPLFLSQSACFRNSRGALSCLTCHDAHSALRANDAAYYNGRCATCHRTAHPPLRAGAKADDCVSCHMPRVEPRPHLRFTNHWIGIYRGNATLRPSR